MPGTRACCAAAAVSGALAALAYAPFDAWPLAWVAWTPWLALLARGPSPRAAAWSGAVHGVVLHAVTCWWLYPVMTGHGGMPVATSVACFALAMLILAPWSVLAALVGSALTRRWGIAGLLGMAVAWAALDAVRARMALGFPWSLPGMTQALVPRVLGAADVLGVHGLTLLVLLANAGLVALVQSIAPVPAAGPRRRAVGVAALAATLLAGSLAWSSARREPAPRPRVTRMLLDGAATQPRWGPGLRVALVQGAAPQEVLVRPDPASEHRRAQVQLELLERGLQAGADLVVWSESAYPGTVGRMPWLAVAAREMLASHGDGQELLTGALLEMPIRDTSPAPPITNSVVLIDADGFAGRYDKVNLVPFGEYVPARRLFFWFRRLVSLVGEMQPGTSVDPIASRHGRLGPFICYESVLPQHVAALARNGAEVLVNVTNDGWYHGTAAPEQHLRFCLVRAAEERRWLLRCANSGVTAIVAPDGVEIGRLEEGERGLLLGSVEPRRGLTPYARWGDAPILVAGLLALAAAGWPRRAVR